MKVTPGALTRHLVLAAAALALAPAAASASSVAVQGDTLVITGSDGEHNDVTVKTAYGFESDYLIVDDNGPNYETSGSLDFSGSCKRYTATYSGDTNEGVLCPRAGLTKVTVTTGDQPLKSTGDRFETISIEVPLAATVDSGAGDDFIYGGPLADTLTGGAGGDYIAGEGGSAATGGGDTLNGDAGDDQIYGGAGDDAINAGEGKDIGNGDDGNDVIRGGGNSDKLDGGDGDDQVFGEAGSDGGDYWVKGGDGSDLVDGGDGDDELVGEDHLSNGYNEGEKDVLVGGPGIDETGYTSRNVAVQVTLDGVANDGEMNDGGTVVENDNVMADVERVYGSYGNDILVGGGGNEHLIGLPGNDVVHGGAGNDEIEGRSGTDLLDGQDGDDKIYGSDGNDKILGGNGNDMVEGGADDDEIEGGAGIDSFAGDTLKYQAEIAGNDTIKAVDGAAEPVSCGAGTDTAFVDSTDTVSADPGNICETKTVTAAAPGGSTAGPGAGPNVVGPIDAKLGFAVAKLLGVKLGSVNKAKAFNVPVGVAGPGQLKISAYVPLTRAGKASVSAKKKSTLIGKGAKAFFAAGEGKVKVKLNAKGRKALKKARKVTMTLKVSFKNAAGKTTRTTRKITLKK